MRDSKAEERQRMHREAADVQMELEALRLRFEAVAAAADKLADRLGDDTRAESDVLEYRKTVAAKRAETAAVRKQWGWED